MADDDRAFVERVDSAAEKLLGGPADTDKMIENFALCGLKRRAGVLENLDSELHGEIDSGGPHLQHRRPAGVEADRCVAVDHGRNRDGCRRVVARVIVGAVRQSRNRRQCNVPARAVPPQHDRVRSHAQLIGVAHDPP